MGRSTDGSLTIAETALMKAMLRRGTFRNEQIAAYFNHPARTFNQGRVTDAKQGKRWAHIEPATEEELDQFLTLWHERTPSPAATFAALGPLHPSRLALLFPEDPANLGHLAAEESSEAEFKLSYQWKAKSKYAKSVAALANNLGGYLLFGVENTTRRVDGVDEAFWDGLDPRKLSQAFGQVLAPAPDVQKTKVMLAGKPVGVLYVKEAKDKPVVCTAADSDLTNGAVYFRYPAESCAIKSSELIALLRERDRRTEERMATVVQQLQKIGTGRAAIIDLETGRVDGQMGHFLLPAELLPQVRVVQEGRLVDVDGAPALRLVGDLQVVGASTPEITIRKENLQDEDLIEDFLRQRMVQNPEDYLRYLGHSGALWLPAYYYARQAQLSDPEAADLVAAGRKNKKKMVGKQEDRIRGHQLPKLVANLSRDAFAPMRACLAAGEEIALNDDAMVQTFLKAAVTIGNGEVELPSLLAPLLRIFDERYRTLGDYPMQLFRIAVVRADMLFFSEGTDGAR